MNKGKDLQKAWSDNEDTLAPPPKGRLRPGWTTGTCASAAAKAATLKLLTGVTPDRVSVPLPRGGRTSFAVQTDSNNNCYVVKFAGDDPDCTDGAHLTAVAEILYGKESDDVILEGGEGIGRVTMGGLGLEIGAPAINPVPRRMITAAVREVTSQGVRIEISVPGGAVMAEKTTNARLGILGGISILGTTGIVRPFSTASFRAAIVQQLNVAKAQSQEVAVLATGSKSDQAARSMFPMYPNICFVEVGDYTGAALSQCARLQFKQIHWVGMVGKVTKLAQGMMMTHFHRSNVDTNLLHEVASKTTDNHNVIQSATATNTARFFFETCIAEHDIQPLHELAQLAKQQCEAHIKGATPVSITMVDFEGDRIITSTQPKIPTLFNGFENQ